MLEREIVNGAIARLRALPHAWAQKRHGSPLGITGDPDVTGAIGGIRFELEGKRPGQKPTKLQAERLKRWAACGCITGVFHTPDEAVEIVLTGVTTKIKTIRGLG